MRKIKWVICILICGLESFGQTNLSIVNLRCEYENNPLGIETGNPRLAWQIKSNQRSQLQSAYRVLIADNPEKLANNKGNIWDTKKIKSDQSIQIEYSGTSLQPTRKYYWKVKVWNQSGQESDWSETAWWQMGLPDSTDWGNARWISMPDLDESKYTGMGKKAIHEKTKSLLPQFRKDFDVTKPVKNATAFVSGLGHFDLRMNGKKVSDHFLDPGWVNYEKHSYYVTFDITKLLRKGGNTIGVMLGNGLYNLPPGRFIRWDMEVMHGLPRMICRIFVEYEDGTLQIIESDQSWKATRSPITYGTIYGGEDFDARLEQDGWDTPGFNDSAWQQAVIVKGNNSLRSQRIAPNKVMETFEPVKIFKSRKGKWVYDFGQNASGIIKLTAKGKAGDSIKIYPGELIDNDSSVTQKATGGPYCFTYIFKGKNSETWQPQFSYYGFRYAQLEGGIPEGEENPGNLPVIKELRSLHTRNSTERAGSFWCSNDLFNKTYRLIDWAMKSNMSSVLTDCPHREKLGWLEVSHLMGASIQYNYNIATFYTKIVNDIQSSQYENGFVPTIAPQYISNFSMGVYGDSPEWSSAYVILPWYMYQWYGDTKLLSENYEGLKKYLDYLETKSKNKIISFGLGDWYDLGPKGPGPSQLTSLGLTGTAIWYYDVNILIKIAKLLGKNEDVKKYNQLAKEIQTAFNQTYFNEKTFQYDKNSQAANGMAIFMGLAEPKYKEKVLDNLVKDIRNRNNGLTAGDVGYRYVLRALEGNGASNVIFDMNSRSDIPGYGYQLKQGATALTESWQALRSVSHNHLMLGHIMEWFYSGLAGIDQEETSNAYKNIIIKPEVVGDVSSVKAGYKSMYGTIKSEWEKRDGIFELNVEIPVNTNAVIYLPAINAASVTENGKPVGNEIKFLKKENGRFLYSVGSGIYSFKCITN